MFFEIFIVLSNKRALLIVYNSEKMNNDRINQLLLDLKDGRMESFDEFYELTKRGVFSVSYQILKNQEEAENVLQDTYLKFLKNLSSMKTDKSVLAYLMQTAKNLSLNTLKQYKRKVNSFDMESVPQEEKKEDDTVLEVMRKTLKPKEYQIVLMHCLYDMTHKEIAEALHRPLGSITWAYNNAIKKVKEALKEYGYQE